MSYGYGGAPPPGGFGAAPGYGSPGVGVGPYGSAGSSYPGAGVPSPYGSAVGGYAGPMVAGVPQGADPQLWQWFTTVDSDRSGSIHAEELQQCLINGDWSPFDLDTVRMLMSIFDTDRSGTITFNEFAGVWKYIKDWQGVFRRFDADRSGTIDRSELRNALREFGYELSPQLLELLLYKFQSSPPAGPGSMYRAQPQGISFDRFLRACVTVKSLTEAFQRLDNHRRGVVTLDYDQFMSTILSTP